MPQDKPMADTSAYGSVQPTVHAITVTDLKDALVHGFEDFMAMPTHLPFIALIYPIVGLVAARVAAGYDVVPLVFPLVAGYTLIGPLVATGMYELSRRREKGLDTSRWHAFDVLKFASVRPIAILGLVLALIYFAWLFAARAIYQAYFGEDAPESIMLFIGEVFSTQAGWGLIVVGCGVGFVFAVVVFSLSVVSFPMLLDREIGVMTAISTSVRAVVASPFVMAVWAYIVVGVLMIGSLPLFVGLAVALPLLGHATWHVYRKAVEP